MSAAENEKRLGKVYEILNSTSSFELPTNITADDLKVYVEQMIEAAQPRHIRVDGRPSVYIKDYKVPEMYIPPVTGNTVNYHHSVGPVYLTLETVEDDGDDEVTKTNLTTNIPNGFVERDFAKYLVHHIFKNGRKTLDELTMEITGMDARLITLIVNGLLKDGYLQKFIEPDGLYTYELVSAKDEEEGGNRPVKQELPHSPQ